MNTRFIILILTFSFLIWCQAINAQIITTVDGTGVQGFSGDGGPAIEAQLRAPKDISLDAAGNIYISDINNHRIRKVSVVTGIISTIAGNGIEGYSGDGGLATNASLNLPYGICVDAFGENVYIADGENYRIRKVVTSTGIITTIAGTGVEGYSGDGGTATDAKITKAVCVVVVNNGDFYIADYQNHRIRKITASTGIITTVAGNGTPGFSGDGGSATSAKLNYPTYISFDADKNLYIVDRNNQRIRKVVTSTGIITTIAGTGVEGYSGDGGLATSASLNQPESIFTDVSGDLYFVDYINFRIRKITASTGIITTVAGNGTQGYSGDGGPAIEAQIYATGVALDTEGNILIADFSNHRIRKVTVSSSTPETPGLIGGSVSVCVGSVNVYSVVPVTGATSYTWSLPTGWTGSSTSNTIQVIADLSSGTISVTANNVNGSSNPRTLAVSGNLHPEAPTITQDGNNITCDTTASGYQWYFNNSIIPNTNSQTYTPPQPGYYQVEITDANGCTAKSDSLYMKGSGIDDVGNSLPVIIYPNPFQDQLIIELEDYRDTHVEIVNLQGQNIQFVILKSTGTIINTNDMSVGMYLVKVRNDKGLAVRKFIKN